MYDQIKLYEPDQEFQELCMISYFMSGFYVISFRDEEFAIKLLKFLENLLSSSESVLRTWEVYNHKNWDFATQTYIKLHKSPV
jgi:hypothetical protein